MRQEYLDYILKNININKIHSYSSIVECFGDEFGLKYKDKNGGNYSATFSKCLKELSENGMIERSSSFKVDVGWGRRGGNVIWYRLTSKGFEEREKLLNK